MKNLLKRLLTWCLVISTLLALSHLTSSEPGPLLCGPVFADPDSEDNSNQEGQDSEEAEPVPLPVVEADFYLLMLGESDQELLSKNADEITYPASTTKMMTALVVLENVENLDEIVTVDEESPFVGGSVIYIDVGEKISVRDLLYAMLVASGNDAASALAVHVGGSIEGFVDMMNAKADELGCQNTHFANPHGLHDDDHYTTARDLYLIAKAAMENEIFKEIVFTSEYSIAPTNKQPETRHLYSTNALLYGGMGSYEVIEDLYGNSVLTAYPYCIGIKTGYTEEAGRCLVSAAIDGDNTVYSIVLHSNDYVFQDSVRLLEYGLFGMKSYDVIEMGEKVGSVSLDNAQGTVVELVSLFPLTTKLAVPPKKEDITIKIDLDPNLALPIFEGEKIGTAEAYMGKKFLGRTDIASNSDHWGQDLLDDQITREEKKITINWWWIAIRLIIVLVLFFIITVGAYSIGIRPKPRPRRPRNKDRSNY